MVNKVLILGFVGKDPDIKNFDNGSKASFSVAVTERGYTTKNGTVVPEQTEWFNVVVFGGLAGVVEKYVQKGTQVFVEGKQRTRSYEKDGQTRYVTEVYADNIELLGRGSGDTEKRHSEPENEPGGINDDGDLPF